jgi:predicted PurR-regulated permease PerM
VPEQVADQGEQLVQGAARPVLAALGGVLSVAATMLSLLFLTLFSLIFGGSLTRALLTEARPERRELYQRMLDKTYDSVGGYVVGLLFICTVNGVLTTVFLAVTDTPFFLPLGILSGFSSMVPYAGPIVVGSGITLITFATLGTVKALMAATWFILYGQFEGQILAPLVFKRTVHINPLLTLASVLFFGELAGIAGAVLAVPLTTTLQIVARELLAIRRARMQLVEPAAPEGTPPPTLLPPGPVPPANPPTPLQ